MKTNKKAQQEIAGFVIIIVIVVIALLVFLIVKVNGEKEVSTSILSDNIMQAVLQTSSPCQLNGEYKIIEDLLSDCYENKQCVNLKKNSCDVLNSTLKEVLDKILSMEANLNAYQINYTFITNNVSSEKLVLFGGNCTGTVYGSVPFGYIVDTRLGNSVNIDLKICIN